MNRTRAYLWPQTVEYPVTTTDKLRKMEAVYIGNEEFKDYDHFYVVLPHTTTKDDYIESVYYDFKIQKHVAVVRMLEKNKMKLEAFWAGEYDKMYTDVELERLQIRPKIGNQVSQVYHTLKNTEIGKKFMKEKLIKFRYADPNTWNSIESGVSWEDFLPETGDFPPSKKQEILHFSS